MAKIDNILLEIKQSQDHIYCPRCGNSTHAESKCEFCAAGEHVSEKTILINLKELFGGVKAGFLKDVEPKAKPEPKVEPKPEPKKRKVKRGKAK